MGGVRRCDDVSLGIGQGDKFKKINVFIEGLQTGVRLNYEMFFNPSINGSAPDAEQAGGFGFVPAGPVQSLQEIFFAGRRFFRGKGFVRS